jgi:formate dehydrogenase subunit delta
MDADNLVRMANRIAEFFAAMPDHDEAVDGVASHLRKFWAPVMRQDLLAQVAASGDPAALGLHPLVAEALARHGEALRPA